MRSECWQKCDKNEATRLDWWGQHGNEGEKCPTKLGKRAVVSRFAGAVLRAILVVLLIVTPSLMVPGTPPDTAQIVALLAFLAGTAVVFEYASSYPSLIEFREAPPFNRIRFLSLFATIFLVSLIVRGGDGASDMTHLVQLIGSRIGSAMDFPYSPVNLVVLMLPADAPAKQVDLLRTAAGMSYLISLISLAFFAILLRAKNWPSGNGRRDAFNIWVNLPTFDPANGGDIVYRLERDAVINIALGFVLPFVTPAVVTAAGSLFGSVSVTNVHTMIWTVAAWAFLPASLFMRGIAMGRVANMIKAERQRRAQDDGSGARWQPV